MDVELSSEPYRIEITVRNRNGNTRRVQVDRLETIENLKFILARSGEDLPPDQQRLVFAGTQLEDERTLADYDIDGSPWRSMVNLEPMHWSFFGMRIFVEVASGEWRIALDIGSPWTPIWGVKHLIQDQKGIPVERQQLSWRGLSPCAREHQRLELLEDNHLLASYNIRCDSVLTLEVESE